MITTVSDATHYLSEKIQQITHEDIDQDVLESIVEEKFYNEIEKYVSQEDIEVLKENDWDDEFAEKYMVTKIPNYISILENVIKDVFIEYVREPVSA